MHDAGKIALGLGAFVALATGPVWLAAGRGRGAPPQLERPVGSTRCIEPTAIMRARHMEILDAWRDAVVRRDERIYVAADGQQHRMSLTGTCVGCHVEPAKFCDRCHAYSGVETFCWDCHKKGKKALTARLTAEGAEP